MCINECILSMILISWTAAFSAEVASKIWSAKLEFKLDELIITPFFIMRVGNYNKCNKRRRKQGLIGLSLVTVLVVGLMAEFMPSLFQRLWGIFLFILPYFVHESVSNEYLINAPDLLIPYNELLATFITIVVWSYPLGIDAKEVHLEADITFKTELWLCYVFQQVQG